MVLVDFKYRFLAEVNSTSRIKIKKTILFIQSLLFSLFLWDPLPCSRSIRLYEFRLQALLSNPIFSPELIVANKSGSPELTNVNVCSFLLWSKSDTFQLTGPLGDTF